MSRTSSPACTVVLQAGAVFGVMMAMMGMLPMIGQMVGSSSSVVGFVIHMVNSAVIGAAFAVVFGGVVAGTGSGGGYGLGYGVIWWLLGPLTLMPLFLGMASGQLESGRCNEHDP